MISNKKISINQIDSSSLTPIAVFNAFTSSYSTGSFTGSFIGSLQGTSSYALNGLSASYALSSSFSENSISSSYALTASYLDNYVPAFPFTGSAEITGSLEVIGSVTATSFTGSLEGTSSYASNSTSASYALSSSFSENSISSSFAISASYVQNQILTPTLLDSYLGTRLTPTNTSYNGFTIEKSINGNVGYIVRNVDNTGNGAIAGISVLGSGSGYYDGGMSLNAVNNGYFITYLRNTAFINSTRDFKIIGKTLDFRTGDIASATSRLSISQSLVTIPGTLTVSQGITGSLFGTSSWAENSLTASFVTASNVFGPYGSNSVISASYALTSSFSENSISSSFALTSSYTTAISGTDNYVPKFNGTSTLENSIIYDDGTNIGIGTISPGSKLHVNGTFIAGASTTSGLFYNTANDTLNISNIRALEKSGASLYLGNTNTTLIFRNNSSERMRITSTGNIGIGTTVPSASLHIQGSGATSATTALLVENSNRSGSLIINNAGNIGIGNTNPSNTLTITAPAGADSVATGSELLTSTDWTTTGWTGDFTSGFTHTPGNTSVLSHTFTPTLTSLYLVSWTMTNRTAGSVVVALGGGSVAATNTNMLGLRASTTGSLTVTPSSDFNGTLILSVKVANTYPATVLFRNSSNNSTSEIRTSASTTNLFFGSSAGARNLGVANTAIGASTLNSNITGNYITAIGSSIFTGAAFPGNVYNIGVGGNIGTNNNFTGIINTFIGWNIGTDSITTTANNTIAIGYMAFRANGSSNTVIGNHINRPTGSFSENVNIGDQSMFSHTTGNQNTSLGFRAGRYQSDGTTANDGSSNSIFIGANSRALSSSQTNQIVIGHTAIGLGSNTTVIGNSSTTTTALYGRTLLGTTTDNGTDRLQVSGSTSINGNTNITGRAFISSSTGTVSGSSLTVYGSGSTQPVFTVQGSQGELFSITDSLSGSLFSVNDISGLPILEVFSDNTTLIGNYQDPMLITTAKNVLTNSGSFTIYSLPTASYDTAFFEYSIRSGSNARAGQIMAIQDGANVNYTETTTTDFGSTSGVSLGVFISGSNMVLTGSADTTAWTIKTIIRSI